MHKSKPKLCADRQFWVLFGLSLGLSLLSTLTAVLLQRQLGRRRD